ncbi:MAG TPA: hypothetical protein VFP72_16645 [Kineosporiaceae bacterium]|nr:hypothetical protein [Kineosporiaceae bacterium]
MRSWAMEVSYLMYDNGDVIVFTHPDHPRVPSPPKNGRPRKNQSQKDQGERSQDSDGGSGSSR